MKLKHLIAPVLALALASSWIANERHTISNLEAQSAALKTRLIARADGSGTDDSPSSPQPPGKPSKGKEPIDWKKIAANFQEMSGANGMGDMRAMMRLQQRLQAMTKDELVSALDEIAALEISDGARNHLEQMLVGPLAEKDPEFTLNRYLDRLDDGHTAMSWLLAHSMTEWLQKNPQSAISWFDQQIAAGKFNSKSLDGKSRSRTQFEGAVIASLLTSDPSAAAARLKSLPENQRGDALRNNFGDTIKEEDQVAFARLVREGLPESEQSEALAQAVNNMANGDGYTKITDYLDRIQATPAERAACVKEAAQNKIMHLSMRGKITREHIDEMRTWATTQAPEATAKATASALSMAIQGHKKLSFSEAAAMALEYDQQSGNNEILKDFLTGGAAYHNKVEAKALAEKITDPKLRAEILERFE